MNLSKANILKIPATATLQVPDKSTFNLPEKVLQFGTGVLLRGLPDFIINNANKRGQFNGRIVIVKSTGNGMADAFEKQDALYTVCVRGIDDGKKISEDHIITSVSRVLSAANEWDQVLECAANPEMQVIISNTTEVGIALVKDNIHADPPQSFPGKLLSFLYHRFKYFKGDLTRGMVIIPTELIPANGEKLLSIVLELAHINSLEIAFIDWLENANHFCNSLVDRIVPGKLSAEEQGITEEKLGYKDELMIMSEVYGLWAIQSGNEHINNILSFATDKAVILAPDINKFRELKLRLLNGSHTFSCGLAYLAGFTNVKEAMDDEVFAGYLKRLMYDEIIPSILDETITLEQATGFANKVLDRYHNSFIDHHWLSITMQYSSKMYLRNIPVIENYITRFGHTATHMALGMAGHILFMRSEKKADGKYYGSLGGNEYLVNDDNAAFFADAWKQGKHNLVVHTILNSEEIWGTDLSVLNGFEEAVLYWLELLMKKGISYALQEAGKQKIIAVK